MGVSGAGKSTIGMRLAERLGAVFQDGDQLHSDLNIAKMAAGEPLDDVERFPWLEAIGERIAAEKAGDRSAVVACSALKRAYRDVLRTHVPELFMIFLDGPPELIGDRISRRVHEFMPTTLLQSQFASLEPLEPDEAGMRVDVSSSPDHIVDEIVTRLGAVEPVETLSSKP